MTREHAAFSARLFGLDRSGPQPTADRRGRAAHPLTIPNLVGYLRLAGIPVFLYLALELRRRPHGAVGDRLLAIAAGDYLDGFLARVTGQYSRMGALLDPLVDRLTILAGVVVCWNFELLPRWALALLAARELVTLVLAQFGAAPRGRYRGQLGGALDLGLPDHGRDLPRASDCRLDRAGDVLRGPGRLASGECPIPPHGPRRHAAAGEVSPGRRRGNIPAWAQPQLDLCPTRL